MVELEEKERQIAASKKATPIDVAPIQAKAHSNKTITSSKPTLTTRRDIRKSRDAVSSSSLPAMTSLQGHKANANNDGVEVGDDAIMDDESRERDDKGKSMREESKSVNVDPVVDIEAEHDIVARTKKTHNIPDAATVARHNLTEAITTPNGAQ